MVSNEYSWLFRFFPSLCLVFGWGFFSPYFTSEAYSLWHCLFRVVKICKKWTRMKLTFFSLNIVRVYWARYPCQQMRWDGYIEPTWENIFELFATSFCAQLINGLIYKWLQFIESIWQKFHLAAFCFLLVCVTCQDGKQRIYFALQITQVFANSEAVW